MFGLNVMCQIVISQLVPIGICGSGGIALLHGVVASKVPSKVAEVDCVDGTEAELGGLIAELFTHRLKKYKQIATIETSNSMYFLIK